MTIFQVELREIVRWQAHQHEALAERSSNLALNFYFNYGEMRDLSSKTNAAFAASTSCTPWTRRARVHVWFEARNGGLFTGATAGRERPGGGAAVRRRHGAPGDHSRSSNLDVVQAG
eukprot:4571300-Prymnesium_polylepis.2